MSINLKILLLIFAISFFLIVYIILLKKKIPVKYSLVWFLTSLVLFLVAVFPDLIHKITKMMGFETTSNMIIGIILCLLLFITMVLTIIVSKQNKQIILLIQEVSMLKERKDRK